MTRFFLLQGALVAVIALPPAFANYFHCINDKQNGATDDGCGIGGADLCVASNGVLMGHDSPGNKCVPCVESNPYNNGYSPFNENPDDGCSASRPFCVLEDGSTSPPHNYGGVQCVGQGGITTVPGDLGLRFNKIKWLPNVTPSFSTLGPDDYPMRGALARTLQYETYSHSVVTTADPSLRGAQVEDHYLPLIGGRPNMPNSDSSHEYWPELEHIVDVQIARIRGDPVSYLTNFKVPDLWNSLDIDQVAERVHDEYPGSNQADFLIELFKEEPEFDHDVVPFRCQRDFIGLEIRFADLNTWAMGEVAPRNFNMKWTVGRSRPEEIAYMIAKGDLTESDGVPMHLVAKIIGMDLTSAEAFTAYPEGCPLHPAWPAMHSAGSSSSLWLATIMKLTPAQYCQALRMDYAVSYARTIAGVQYTSDNIAGLNLGHEIIKEELPSHFAKNYGSDENAVRAKMQSKLFDWADFDPVTCEIGGVAVF